MVFCIRGGCVVYSHVWAVGFSGKRHDIRVPCTSRDVRPLFIYYAMRDASRAASRPS